MTNAGRLAARCPSFVTPTAKIARSPRSSFTPSTFHGAASAVPTILSPSWNSTLAYTITAALLGSGKGSRLHQRLVREQQVATTAVAFSFDLSRGSDLLILEATAHPSIDPATLEAAVVGEVDALVRDGCTDAEVERAVTLTTTEFVTSMQSAQARADRLSQYATYLGEPRLLNAQVAAFEAVTADAVTRFARTWLGEDNRASLVYVPRASEASA